LQDRFVYTAHPSRVVFGAGSLAALADEVKALGCHRAFVLTTPQQEAAGADVVAQLGPLAAGLFPGAAMHTPIAVTERALAAFEAAKADCTVAIGGGSTTGLGKALALRTNLPQIVVPTTYAGSEMTNILGETADGKKTTQRDARILPETVIYDVDLTLGLPVAISVTSGINAIAHAVEALYAQDRNPITSLIAEEGVRALTRALPDIVTTPPDPTARRDALYGAWLCGVCLGAAGMALHHKLCHVLGGAFNLPHAETHTVVLPHALAYNAPAAPEAAARIAAAMGVEDAAQGLYDLIGRLGGPRSLREIGMPEDGVERAAALAVESPYWNPRPIEREPIRALLERAYRGVRPEA
jgi:maleylacetate reductase